MKKYLALLLAAAVSAVGICHVADGANPRNRQRAGYRGRVTQQLTGRQSSSADLRIGVGNDPLANLVHQGGGPRTVANAAPAYHRIPILAKAANGDYLCFYDARSASADETGYAILMIRSTDRAVSWGSPTTVYSHSAYVASSNWIVSGSVVVDDVTTPGNIFFFFTKATGGVPPTAHTIYYVKSTDHGATWGAAQDITANVKVTDGTHPTGHGFPATPWTFCVPTCTAGIVVQNGTHRGRMIVPFDHRTVDFTGTTVWSHVIKSDDAGANWGLYNNSNDGGRGGVDQTNASNNGSNECAITETPTTDKLVMQCRNVSTGNPRYQSISTDCGANWSVISALTNLQCGVSSGTSSDVKQCGPLTVAAYSSDVLHAQRATLCLGYSTDQGTTWPASTARLMGTGSYAGYSSMLVDGNSILVAYEGGGGNISSLPATTFSSPTAYGIKLLRTNLQYLLHPTLRYSQWFFNEEANGVTAQTFGSQIIDYGNLGVNATTGTAAAPPSYTSDGIAISSATADKIILAQADETAFDFLSTDSFTVEVEATLTASTTGVLAGKLSGNTGWQFEVTAGGKLKGTIGDGTQLPVTGVTTVNGGGTRRVYAFVRDVVADTIQVYVDGTPDATAVTDTTTGNLGTGGVPLIVGDNNAGTLPLGATIHSVRITRGVPTTLLSGAQTKKTQDEFRRNTNSVVAYPAVASPKLWVCRTSDNGLSSFGDVYASERCRMPLQVGDAIRSFRDNSVLRRRFYNSESTRMLYAVDSKMGPCFDLDELTVTDNARIKDLTCYGATNGVDFIQNTGIFTIAFAINVKGSTTNYQVIASNNDASGTASGFYISRNDGASSKLTFVVGNGSTAQFNETIATAPAISYGTTYFCAFVGQGPAAKVKLYVIPITANYDASSPTQPAAAASNVYTSSANFGSAGTYTTSSGAYLTIGGRTTANNVLNAYLKNVMIFDSTLSASDIDALALYFVGG